MSMDLSITTSAPADPATVTEYGDALPELVRALSHVTLHHEALAEPSDADRLIRNVSLAVSRLPQLLEQVSGWLVAEQAAGRIGIAEGSGYFSAAPVVIAARGWLEKAQAHARILQQALDAVASMTTDMTRVEEGSDDEDE